MKRNLALLFLGTMIMGLSMSGCRNRELCPAYTDSEPLTQQVAQDQV
ncbi:MAG: hypothetical protein R6U64_08310 [Bacteroidales bacterium]